MRGPIIFLLLIPFLIAIGHDFYLFYNEHGSRPITLDLIQKEFKFSALGFIWTTYSLDTFKEVARSVDKETWATIDSFLTMRAAFVTGIFAGVFILLFTILAMFGKGPFKGEGSVSYSSSGSKDFLKKGKKMEYKRK